MKLLFGFFSILFYYLGKERDRGFYDIKTFRFFCCISVMPPVILFLTSVAGFVLIKCNCLCLICVWLAVCSRNSARKNPSWALFRHCFGKLNEPNYLVAAYLVHNCDDRNSFRCVSHRQKFIQGKDLPKSWDEVTERYKMQSTDPTLLAIVASLSGYCEPTIVIVIFFLLWHFKSAVIWSAENIFQWKRRGNYEGRLKFT